ncbi:hypothetical protein BCL90_2741 [Pedobacter alluvionis]|uniref:Uncharacterized protein n=1 Tax=Pedobacter alluvionis TaxID=475253 RepID=A0A497Y4B2_9SPHI|nr:hypothetical protein BCL90_2741 [Pedobacter alluvionis]
MKYFMVILLLLCCGCLVPGAPHWFKYKSNGKYVDSVIIISYPNALTYKYKSAKRDYDSILVLDPIHRVFRRMEIKENFYFNETPHYSFHKRESWNLVKMEKVDYVIIKRYHLHSVTVDTLCYIK